MEFADGIGFAGHDPVIGVDSASEVFDSATGTAGVFLMNCISMILVSVT